MDFKYKIADVAKEFGVPTKKVIETVGPITGESYKTGSTFGEKELNLLLETLTRENAEGSLDAYLASGAKAEPTPAPKAEEKSPSRRSLKPRRPRRKSLSRKRTARPRTSPPRSAAKSALPCRSWPPTPASRSLSRLWSRCRSTVRRCLWIPAPSM